MVDAFAGVLRGLDGLGGEVAGGLDELDVIEGDEGGEGGVGEVAAGAEGFADGGVEDLHRRVGGGAFPDGVEGAAVEAVAFVLLVEAGVRALHGDGFPDVGGLVGADGGAAFLIDEEAGGVEGHVADLFGIEPMAWGAGEEFVAGVFFAFQGIKIG